jgi:biotin transport system ATP-binding protein
MGFIQINNLTHIFPDGSTGLNDINLSIQPGEFLVIAGANGSGKTTLCRHLNGLLRPTHGSVLLDGISVSKDLLRARQIVGMVFQNADTQIIGETVYTDIAFGPENLGLNRQEINARVESAMEIVGLQDFAYQKPYLLSGG